MLHMAKIKEGISYSVHELKQQLVDENDSSVQEIKAPSSQFVFTSQNWYIIPEILFVKQISINFCIHC